MEALASSVFVSGFPESYQVLQTPPSSSIKPFNRRIGSLKIRDDPLHFTKLRILALAQDTSGEGEKEVLAKRFELVPEGTAPLSQARFAHLCTVMSRMHHRREGYPFGSLVDFAPDSMGHPIFSFSPLAIHTRNLLVDPRCTLVVQVPGWSGLSNARVTIFGDVFPLSESHQEWAHKQYIAKHHQGPSQQWGNFYYFRMQTISDILFIGGFGTVAWVDVKEYEAVQPDKIAVDGGEQNLKELNAKFSKPLKELLSAETEIDDAALISIDSRGVDIRVRQGAQFNIQRLSFEEGKEVQTLEEAKSALARLINKGRVQFA